MPNLDSLFTNLHLRRESVTGSRDMSEVLEMCLAKCETSDDLTVDVSMDEQHLVRLYVGNISAEVTEDCLSEIFGLKSTPYLKRLCRVERAEDESGKSKNYAYVFVPESVHAEILNLNGIELYGGKIVIKISELSDGNSSLIQNEVIMVPSDAEININEEARCSLCDEISEDMCEQSGEICLQSQSESEVITSQVMIEHKSDGGADRNSAKSENAQAECVDNGSLMKFFPKDAFTRHVIDGNGYCIVQSVIKGIENLRNTKLEQEDVLRNIKLTFQQNLEEYSGFINTCGTDPIDELDKYINFGNYGSDVTDLVMHILSKYLKVTIVILHYKEDEKMYIVMNENHIILSNKHHRFDNTIYMEKINDHYNLLLPLDVKRSRKPSMKGQELQKLKKEKEENGGKGKDKRSQNTPQEQNGKSNSLMNKYEGEGNVREDSSKCKTNGTLEGSNTKNVIVESNLDKEIGRNINDEQETCAVCTKYVSAEGVWCCVCEEWMHYECIGSTEKQVSKDYPENEDYICILCTKQMKEQLIELRNVKAECEEVNKELASNLNKIEEMRHDGRVTREKLASEETVVEELEKKLDNLTKEKMETTQKLDTQTKHHKAAKDRIVNLEKRITELSLEVRNHQKVNCAILETKVNPNKLSNQEEENDQTGIPKLQEEINELKSKNGDLLKKADKEHKALLAARKEIAELKQFNVKLNEKYNDSLKNEAHAIEKATLLDEEVKRRRKKDEVLMLFKDQNGEKASPGGTESSGEQPEESEALEKRSKQTSNEVCKDEFIQRGSCKRMQCRYSHNINRDKEGVCRIKYS